MDIISIDYMDKNDSKLAAFIKAHEMDWIQPLGTRAIMQYLGVQAYPFGIITDENYVIRKMLAFPADVERLVGKK